jgi:hypothetical protein
MTRMRRRDGRGLAREEKRMETRWRVSWKLMSSETTMIKDRQGTTKANNRKKEKKGRKQNISQAHIIEMIDYHPKRNNTQNTDQTIKLKVKIRVSTKNDIWVVILDITPRRNRVSGIMIGMLTEWGNLIRYTGLGWGRRWNCKRGDMGLTRGKVGGMARVMMVEDIRNMMMVVVGDIGNMVAITMEVEEKMAGRGDMTKMKTCPPLMPEAKNSMPPSPLDMSTDHTSMRSTRVERIKSEVTPYQTPSHRITHLPTDKASLSAMESRHNRNHSLPLPTTMKFQLLSLGAY